MAENRRHEAGVTLVELLVAIAIGGFVTAALTSSFIIGIRATQATAMHLSGSQSVQLVSAYLIADAQSADQVPDASATAPWPCAAPSIGSRNLVTFEWKESNNATPAVVTSYAATWRFQQAIGSYTRDAATRWQLIRAYCKAGQVAETVVTARELADPAISVPTVVTDASGGTTIKLFDASGYAFTIKTSSRKLSAAAAASPVVSVSPSPLAPLRTSLRFEDANSNGKVDRVVATYTHGATDDCLGTVNTAWKLEGLPSDGLQLSNPTRVGNAITVPITELALGTADTAAASLRVTFVKPDSCALPGFTSDVPGDEAPPVITSIQSGVTGATAGLPEKDDTATIGFSEPIVVPASVLAATSLQLKSGTGQEKNSLVLPQVTQVDTNLNVTDYYSGNGNRQVSFDMAVTAGADHLTMRLLSACLGNKCSELNPNGGSAATIVMTPVSTIKDASGNAARVAGVGVDNVRFF